MKLSTFLWIRCRAEKGVSRRKGELLSCHNGLFLTKCRIGSFLGIESKDSIQKKHVKLVKKWRIKDGVSEDERLAYHGPWPGSMRWMLCGFQGMSLISVAGLAAHHLGLAPIQPTAELATLTITSGDALAFCLGLLGFTACVSALVSALVLRVYHDDSNHEFRVVKPSLLHPWKDRHFTVGYGELAPVKWHVFQQMVFRNEAGKVFLMFTHRFRYPDDYNRLLGYFRGFEDEEEDEPGHEDYSIGQNEMKVTPLKRKDRRID